MKYICMIAILFSMLLFPLTAKAVVRNMPQGGLKGTMTHIDYLTKEDIARFGKWGINVIRFNLRATGTYDKVVDLAVEAPEVIADPLVPYAASLANLDQLLPALKENNIQVVLALNTTVGRYSGIYWDTVGNTASETDRLNAERLRWHVVEFWIAVSAKYKDESGIIAYDILNEPNFPLTVNGTTNFSGIAAWDNADGGLFFMARKQIRFNDQTIYLVKETMMADYNWLWLTQDNDPVSRVLYSGHFYRCTKYTHQGTTSGRPPGVTYPGDCEGSVWDKTVLENALSYSEAWLNSPAGVGLTPAEIYYGEFGVQRRHDVQINGVWTTLDMVGNNQWLTDVSNYLTTKGYNWTAHSMGGANMWNHTFPYTSPLWQVANLWAEAEVKAVWGGYMSDQIMTLIGKWGGTAEIAANGGFELTPALGTNGYWIKWLDSGADNDIRLSSPNGARRSGDYSLVILSYPAANHWRSAVQQIRIAPSTTYKLSGYIRGDYINVVPGGWGGALLRYQVLDNSGVSTTTQGVTQVITGGDTTFQPVSVTFTTPADARTVYIIAALTNDIQGHAWFDDISLVQIGLQQ